MAERDAFKRSGLALGETGIGCLGLGERMIGRGQDISIERSVAALNCRNKSFRQFSGGERFFLQPFAGFRQRQLG